MNIGKLAWFAIYAASAAVPALAQVDFSGEWAPRFYEDQLERVPGPEIGDYLGIPINDADRMRGDTWSASIMTLPEWQCRPHSADYIWRGPSNLRIWKEVDPGHAPDHGVPCRMAAVDRSADLSRWPSASSRICRAHLGRILDGKVGWRRSDVTVTHVKEGYVRRNGLARSEKAKLTENWIRHGDWLTIVTFVTIPFI